MALDQLLCRLVLVRRARQADGEEHTPLEAMQHAGVDLLDELRDQVERAVPIRCPIGGHPREGGVLDPMLVKA